MKPIPSRVALAALLIALGPGIGAGANPTDPAPPAAPAARGALRPEAAPAALPDGDAAVPALPGGPTADGAPDLEVPPAIRRYIVVLDGPPVAEYRGGIAGLAPTAVDVAGGKVVDGRRTVHLDVDSPAARAYRAYLDRAQDAMIRRIQRLAPEFRGDDWRYGLVLNGFAGSLTPAHAMAVMRLPGVRLVAPEETLAPEMDSTAILLHTTQAWEAAGGTAEAGLNARIAVLDTGGDPGHPWFNDQGMPAAPTGFPAATMHDRAGQVLAYPNASSFTNKKLIGARVFVATASATLLNNLTPLALNNGDHGLHVAGIATGRFGTYSYPLGGGQVAQLEMGGVAPMAHLFHYLVNDNSPGMVAAYEQMLRDEIDAVNISQGHVGWLLDDPAHHPFTLAQSAAAAAGLLTVASAGNAGGNGRASLSGAWKYSEDILAVGNTTTTGSTDQRITVEGDGVPDSVRELFGGPRGSIPYTRPLTAELILADDGGCTVDPKYQGKIAVAERLDAQAQPISACLYEERAVRMRDSGAAAILYVYYDRYLGAASGTALALPAAGLGTKGGVDLVEWLRAGGKGTATISDKFTRGYNDFPDLVAAGSSLGPGLGWEIKPDISAPGTNILSSRISPPQVQGGQPNRYVGPLSGTSMSSPHVAGAATLLRSMHPEWSARQVRGALINASAGTLKSGSPISPTMAGPSEGGPGRLDLAHAYDPGAFLHPPKVSFGDLRPAVSKTMHVRVESASRKTVMWTVEREHAAGDALVTVTPDAFSLDPGQAVTLTVQINTTGVKEAEHWGDIHLVGTPRGTIYLPALLKDASFGDDAAEPDPEPTATPMTTDGPAAPRHDEPAAGAHALRLVYYAHVDLPENRKNVLIVDWTYGLTGDFTDYYTDALDALGLTYTVWGLGEPEEHQTVRTTHPPFPEMDRHDLVIVNSNMSNVSLQEAAIPLTPPLTTSIPGMYQYQNHLLGGGHMLIAGQGTPNFWRYLSQGSVADSPANRAALPDTFPRQWLGPTQNGGCEMCLARYFAGFTPELTATLSGRLLVPFPTRPDEPEMEVVLAPHPDAEGVFDYNLDVSTGAMAKDGAAGNQYRFASGGVMRAYKPSTSAQVTAGLGDVGYAEVVMNRYAHAARPLWSYPVSDSLKVVGTYMAGQQLAVEDPDEAVVWNAMIWGFGLEGVGKGGDDTVSRERLMGDTFNFLAKNIRPHAVVLSADPAATRVRVSLGAKADPVPLERAEIDWGDGAVETRALDARAAVASIDLAHAYAAGSPGARGGRVSITLVPARGTAAPIHVEVSLDQGRERHGGL